jgi:hypothetical protein
MSNNIPPVPAANAAPAQPSWLKENGGAIAGCLVVLAIIGGIIYAIVRAIQKCKMLEDEMQPVGNRKCNSGDEGPVKNCGKWECRGGCPVGFYAAGAMCTSYVKDPITKQYVTVSRNVYEPK